MPGFSASSLVDLERYPIEDLSHQTAVAVIAQAREQLLSSGAAELPGFIHPEGVKALVEDAAKLALRGHHSQGLGGPYLAPADETFAADHPRRFREAFAVSAVAYDIIPFSSPLRQLYDSDLVLDFISAILNRGALYRYADPCGALNLAVMAEGEQLQWHFDQTDFVVSLAIQSAEGGGAFEVVPRIRTASDEHYDEVAEVLAGQREHVKVLEMTPGTLLVFEGRHSLHRVSPIAGPRLRHVGLLAYDTVPGTQSSEHLRELRYGRTMTYGAPPELWPA
jgi:hypothetical protein